MTMHPEEAMLNDKEDERAATYESNAKLIVENYVFHANAFFDDGASPELRAAYVQSCALAHVAQQIFDKLTEIESSLHHLLNLPR